MKHLLQLVLRIFLGLWITIGLSSASQAFSPDAAITLKVGSTVVGATTHYIGACEGNVGFDGADIADLGINAYRIYGGMSRWEPEDDDGVYGLPTIAQIKNNPALIPWTRWDAVMTNPEAGTDYAFSGKPKEMWQGSARTIFKTLKQGHIRPVLTIRNTDPGWHPDWALQLNPPRTEADWNEWWEHVFATVYWLNVRNDYQVNDFEIHNEPDNREQGWGGTQNDYFELVRVASDAIAHVYRTYLPDRQFHIHAPQTVGGSHWPANALASIPDYFDSVNVHTYDLDISNYVRQVRHWMQSTIHARSPLWLGEWGTYTRGYSDLTVSLSLIKNMIRMSQPGETYVYGSHLFSLYDWGYRGGSEGLINAENNRRLSYYAVRLGIRALQGGRSVLLSTTSSSKILAITTQDEQQQLYILLVNDAATSQIMMADVSALVQQGDATLWEFSEQAHDKLIGRKHFSHGKIQLEMPAHASHLAMIRSKG